MLVWYHGHGDTSIHKMTETKQRWEIVLSIYDSIEEKVDERFGKNNVYQCFLYKLLQPPEYLNDEEWT